MALPVNWSGSASNCQPQWMRFTGCVQSLNRPAPQLRLQLQLLHAWATAQMPPEAIRLWQGGVFTSCSKTGHMTPDHAGLLRRGIGGTSAFFAICTPHGSVVLMP